MSVVLDAAKRFGKAAVRAATTPIRPLMRDDSGFSEGDSVIATRGYFDNGCLIGTIMRFEDGMAYVHTEGGTILIHPNELIMAL